MDARKNNKGTIGNKGGRPSKAEEHHLIETLTPFHSDAIEAFKKAVQEEEAWAIKLYMEFFYGKPKQSIDQNVTLDQPLFPKK